ncbi:MAG TPA: DUF58 domain-containing protein [Burkholderiales bacterium]|nr:DUF58 domain-containing protein [Burkholderiales bacterium]
MLIPSRHLGTLAYAIVFAAIISSVWTEFLQPILLIAVLIGIVSAIDGLAAIRKAEPTASRTIAASLPLGVQHEVVLRLHNNAAQTLQVEVFDHYPDGVVVENQPQTLTLPKGGWAEVRYTLFPLQRGDLRFEHLAIRIQSPLRLWQMQRRLPLASHTRVYPNFAALTKFALLATDHRLSQIGVLQRRRRGEGLDFHQLREYREGDSQRQIDWKASARMHKFVSREYQDERDQQIVLLIDCGRRMAAKDDALSHFDHVLNAALLLAYVSLRQGDAVGLATMSGPQRWIAPRKSRATIDLILNSVYDLQPTHAATDYYTAAVELMKRLRKRALVVVLSNMRDEDDDTLSPALQLLQSRHLVLFASLREGVLGRALSSQVDNLDRALTHAATASYLQHRELSFKRLSHHGAVCLDVEPAALPIALVNRYLDIKRTGRL